MHIQPISQILISVEDAMDGRVIHLSYSVPFDEVSQEFYLYNFGGILVAMGGAAGLFIGLSLFQAMSWLLYLRMKKEEEREKKMQGEPHFANKGSTVVGIGP